MKFDFPGICGRSLFPRLRNFDTNQTGDETIVAEDTRS